MEGEDSPDAADPPDPATRPPGSSAPKRARPVLSMSGDIGHPLLREIAALRLPEGGSEEPEAPRGGEGPAPAVSPAALLRLDGERAELGELPADGDGPLPEPPPGVAETARRVARGDLDPEELIEAALGRIARLGPRLRCFVTPTPEPARRRARRLGTAAREGRSLPPLAGVPVAHKDLLLTAGVPTRAGSALLAGCVPDDDAAAVRSLHRAGAISLGKVETHEFATGITGLVSAGPPVRNPWDAERVPGGSSCGSAVAVAAGLVSATTGTDTGGSIRIPAACCGVVGLKPGYGRVSRAGVIPFSWSLDHVGPLTRGVEDAARMLAALLGQAPESVDLAADPGPPQALRFALPERFLRESTPAVAGAVARAADELERLGAIRVGLELPPEVEQVAGIAAAIFLAEGYAVHAPTLAGRGDEYCPETRRFLELGDRVSAERYLTAQRLRSRLRHGMAAAMRQADVVLLPTLPMVTPPIADEEVTLAGERIPVRAALTRFTRLANVTGQPALSLPCAHDPLPVAIQVLGRAGDEATVLRVGAVLEEIGGGVRWPPETR